MKTIKILLLMVFISFTFSSCLDEIVDKICDVGIKELNDEYNKEIKLVENNSNLTQVEKDTQIDVLKDQRDQEVAELKEDCSL